MCDGSWDVFYVTFYISCLFWIVHLYIFQGRIELDFELIGRLHLFLVGLDPIEFGKR
jgi:hypothetical protein